MTVHPPIVINTRTEFWERALETYRAIEADVWSSPTQRERARIQRLQLEAEAPLLELEGGSL